MALHEGYWPNNNICLDTWQLVFMLVYRGKEMECTVYICSLLVYFVHIATTTQDVDNKGRNGNLLSAVVRNTRSQSSSANDESTKHNINKRQISKLILVLNNDSIEKKYKGNKDWSKYSKEITVESYIESDNKSSEDKDKYNKLADEEWSVTPAKVKEVQGKENMFNKHFIKESHELPNKADDQVFEIFVSNKKENNFEQFALDRGVGIYSKQKDNGHHEIQKTEIQSIKQMPDSIDKKVEKINILQTKDEMESFADSRQMGQDMYSKEVQHGEYSSLNINTLNELDESDTKEDNANSEVGFSEEKRRNTETNSLEPSPNEKVDICKQSSSVHAMSSKQLNESFTKDVMIVNLNKYSNHERKLENLSDYISSRKTEGIHDKANSLDTDIPNSSYELNGKENANIFENKLIDNIDYNLMLPSKNTEFNTRLDLEGKKPILLDSQSKRKTVHSNSKENKIGFNSFFPEENKNMNTLRQQYLFSTSPYRSVTTMSVPPVNFKLRSAFGQFPQSVAGSSLYGSYASASLVPNSNLGSTFGSGYQLGEPEHEEPEFVEPASNIVEEPSVQEPVVQEPVIG